jgi:hypothetical protein
MIVYPTASAKNAAPIASMMLSSTDCNDRRGTTHDKRDKGAIAD